jgi:hypothetical protein
MLYTHKLCPACEVGPVGFWRCSDGKTLVLLCDECGAVYLSPDKITLEEAGFPSGPDYELPELGCALVSGKAGWATRAEVEAAGWSAAIAGEDPS